MVRFILVFLAMTALDFVWGEYVKAMARRKEWQSIAAAVGIIVVSGFVTISYVENHWLLVPAGLGAALGTYLAVTRGAGAR